MRGGRRFQRHNETFWRWLAVGVLMAVVMVTPFIPSSQSEQNVGKIDEGFGEIHFSFDLWPPRRGTHFPLHGQGFIGE